MTDYDYDNLNRLDVEQIRRGASGPLVQRYDYELKSNGQRQSLEEKQYDASGNLFSTTTIRWTYDDLDRLTQEERDGGTAGVADGDDYTARYRYDLSGNRLSKDWDSVNDSQDEIVSSYYRSDDQLFAELSSKSGWTSYDYDANGSMIAKANGEQIGRYGYGRGNHRLLGERVLSAMCGSMPTRCVTFICPTGA